MYVARSTHLAFSTPTYMTCVYCTSTSSYSYMRSKESVLCVILNREGTVLLLLHTCYMRFGATLMRRGTWYCGTISVYVTLVVLFVFIKANG
jgi:hypothetical protein